MTDTTRICKICKIEKELSFFRRSRKTDGTYCYNHSCKECGKLDQQKRSKKHYENNKENFLKQSREYHKNNREQLNLGHKKYYEKHKEELLEKCKQYAVDNATKISEYKKQYREENNEYLKEQKHNYYVNNKEECRARSNKWAKNKAKNDPLFRIRRNISGYILKALKKNGSSKNGQSFIKYIDYTIEELKQYLESLFEPWMTWDNHGNYNPAAWDNNNPITWTWQIDHIIPHSTFQYTSMEDQAFRDCWALSNLRPLSAKQNYLDGCTKIRHNIKE